MTHLHSINDEILISFIKNDGFEVGVCVGRIFDVQCT